MLDVVTKIEGFDTGITMLEQRLRVHSDGMSANAEVVAPGSKARRPHMSLDEPLQSCKSAPPTAKEERDERSMYGRPTFGESRRQLCEAVGSYRWDGDRFVRVP